MPAPELAFQKHIADFLVRVHGYGVLEQVEITDTEHFIAEDHRPQIARHQYQGRDRKFHAPQGRDRPGAQGWRLATIHGGAQADHCVHPDRYELGVQLARTVMAQRCGNDCFENNLFLCHLMLNGGDRNFLASHDRDKLANPFQRLNVDVATENPKSWHRDGPPLKSKLLFQDYRFGLDENRKKSQPLFLDLSDGYQYSLQTPLITLGRLDSNNIPFGQNGISRRHAVIINFPKDVWIYDLGSVTGVSVDGVRVSGKAFLDGVHTINIGARAIKVATDEGLLI